MVVVFEGRWVGWFYSNSCFYYLLLLFLFVFASLCSWSIVLVRILFPFPPFFLFGMEFFIFYLSEIGSSFERSCKFKLLLLFVSIYASRHHTCVLFFCPMC